MKIKPGLNSPRPPKTGAQELETPLPCPFCGGEAYIKNKEQANNAWGIGCMSFGCHGEYTIRLANYNSKELAIQVWNIRNI